MDSDDCDLLAIVRSCKATTFTNHTTVFETPTPTNNTISPQNPTPYFEDFTFTQGNSSIPCVPLKPNDFIELEKLKIIPTPTTIPTPITITNNNSVHDTNQNSTFYNFPTLMEQQQIQLNFNQYELDLAEETRLSYYDEPRFEFPLDEAPIFNFQHVSNRVNCIKITTDHFDLAYNHPSLQLQPQPQQELNQLPIQELQTNSMVLPNANPQPNKRRSRKRKNQPMKMICEMNAQKLLEDPWAWRKYGQKPIKGSPYPRSYYRCSSARECGAKKLVEKSHTNENTFLVTYTGEHNHEKPINRIMVGTLSWNKPPETGLLPAAGVAGPPETRLLPAAGVVGPSQNMVSPNAMLWFDQPESSNAPIHGDNAQVNYDDNVVLMPNMAASEASLMNFNHLNIDNIPFVESNP